MELKWESYTQSTVIRKEILFIMITKSSIIIIRFCAFLFPWIHFEEHKKRRSSAAVEGRKKGKKKWKEISYLCVLVVFSHYIQIKTTEKIKLNYYLNESVFLGWWIRVWDKTMWKSQAIWCWILRAQKRENMDFLMSFYSLIICLEKLERGVWKLKENKAWRFMLVS